MIKGLIQNLRTDLDPVIISAPTLRSGTTLFQRLLCSAPGCLIFGEGCVLDLEMLLSVYIAKSMTYSSNQQRFEGVRHRVVEDEDDGWIPDLMPDLDGYVEALGQGCFSGLDYCRTYAQTRERPKWGFKYPGLQPHILETMLSAMPAARLIYIYRDIVDCLRSAKAKQLVATDVGAELFCRSWAKNLTHARSIAGRPSVLLINYSEMLVEPELYIRGIEEFSGVDGIRRDILGKKINSSTDGNADEYLEPAVLTANEMRMIDGLTSTLRSSLFQSD